jgi:hypothetical protein
MIGGATLGLGKSAMFICRVLTLPLELEKCKVLIVVCMGIEDLCWAARLLLVCQVDLLVRANFSLEAPA